MKEPSYSIDYDFAEDMGYTVNDISEETRLWSAVLLRALKDALGLDQDCKRKVDLYKRRAENWFYYGDHDFKMVCEFAGLDPATVQYSILDYLTEPNQKKRVLPNIGQGSKRMQHGSQYKEAA